MINLYKQLSKISPQREKGTRQIVNDVWGALIRAKLSGAQYQIILFILDKSWGFGKVHDGISYNQMKKETNLSRPGIINTIKQLEKKRILIVERKTGNGKLPYNEYLFNKYYDTWLNSNGKSQFTTSDIDELKKKSKLVNKALPDEKENKEQTGKLTKQTGKLAKHKLVNSTLPTKESTTKETSTKERIIILSQIKNLLNQFPQDLKDKVIEFIDIARLENKTEKITDQKRLRLINGLYQEWAKCVREDHRIGDSKNIAQQDFRDALRITVNKHVANINYVKKVKKNIINKRALRVQGK